MNGNGNLQPGHVCWRAQGDCGPLCFAPAAVLVIGTWIATYCDRCFADNVLPELRGAAVFRFYDMNNTEFTPPHA